MKQQMSNFSILDYNETRSISGSYFYLLFFILCVTCAVLSTIYARLMKFASLVNKIPGPDHHPLLNIVIPVTSFLKQKHLGTTVLFSQYFRGYTHLYGQSKGIWRFWSLYRPIFIASKAETVSAILNNSTHINKPVEYYFLRTWLKSGLLISPDKIWKQRRKICTPAFHSRILVNFLPIFEKQTNILIDKLHSLQGSVLDVIPLVTLCTLDIICETAMGKSIEAQSNIKSPYVNGIHHVSEIFMKRITYPWLWFDCIFYRTEQGKKYRRNIQKMSCFVQNVIQERLKTLLEEKIDSEDFTTENGTCLSQEKRGKAFLDLLLCHHISDNNLSLTEIEEEVNSFMFAGHDTTAINISWILYLLGLHQEVQQKARDEIHTIFGGDNFRPITEDDLKQMKYIECIIKETLRLYPSVPFIGRKSKSDLVIDDFVIPAKSSCVIFAYMLHRQEDVFPNAEVFDPDRFATENSVGRHPFAYVPFSGGPRNCMGQKFAMMEEKVMVCNILRHFQLISLDQRDSLQLSMEITLRPVNGLRLKFVPLH